MTKEDLMTFKGEVVEKLPGTNFKVKLENGVEILCTLKGAMKKNKIKVLLHDRVDVEMSPYDVTKGRITFRYKD